MTITSTPVPPTEDLEKAPSSNDREQLQQHIGFNNNSNGGAVASNDKDEKGEAETRSHSLTRTPPQLADSRFGGLAASVEASVRLSVEKQLGSITAPFPVTASDLGHLSSERTRTALAELLELGVLHANTTEETKGEIPTEENGHKTEDGFHIAIDVEAPPPSSSESPLPSSLSSKHTLEKDVGALIAKIKQADAGTTADGNFTLSKAEQEEADKNADMAANVLTSVLLRSSPESGIDPREVEHRRAVFGSNAIAEKETDSFLKLCWEAVQDFVLIMLIVLAVISIVVEVTTHSGPCKTCWIEGAAILCSVVIVVLVTAGIDYAKQFAFLRLTRSLHDTNTKQVIRDAKQVSVTDDDIVVGDILSVNAHNLASIPADCVLLGPPTADLKMNESALTGESNLIGKKPGDVILSGTSASQGSGRMVVIAVGVNSVAGKIKAHVYESADHTNELEGGGEDGEDENSPLFVKLDIIARRIGWGGMLAAMIAFVGLCIIGLGVQFQSANKLIGYLVTAITVLAVAVPEGLPLAVTLALAFSSNKMMKDQNLVKHLDACETMGCATTICTDKTGALFIVCLSFWFSLWRFFGLCDFSLTQIDVPLF